MSYSSLLRTCVFLFLQCTVLVLFSQGIHVQTEGNSYVLEISSQLEGFQKTQYPDSIPVISGTQFIYEQGAPELSKWSHAFLTDNEMGFDVEVLVDSFVEMKAGIAPSNGFVTFDQKNRKRVPGLWYQQNGFYPEQLYTEFDTYVVRKKTFQPFWFYPVQFNPQTQTLRFHSYLKLRLKPKKGAAVKSASIGIEQEENEPSKLLIVADRENEKVLLPFLRWKKQMGFKVYVHLFTGKITASEVKSLTATFYQQEKINYVLLVGDHEQLPAYATVYGLSDYAYGLLDGNDSYSELNVGRFPAKNASELEVMINKSIHYEKALGNHQWLEQFVGICSNEDIRGDKNENDKEHTQKLAQQFSTASYWSNLIVEDEQERSISSIINEGCHYLFYTGHGDVDRWSSVKFNVDSVKELTNNGTSPVVISAACLNGNFSYPNCLAEQFLRASNEKGSTGAVAMLASSISQLWAPPMLGQDLIAAQLLDSMSFDKALLLGDACTNSFYDILIEYGIGGAQTVYTWILFGDPTLALWKGIPEELMLLAPSSINVSCDTFQVRAADGAFLTLLNDTSTLAQGRAKQGIANLLPMAQANLDSVLLTATKSQHIPLSLSLLPYNDAGSYYGFKDIVLTDENNTIAENEEWLSLSPVLFNFGKEAGKNVRVKINSEDDVFQVKNGTKVLERIDGESSTIIRGIQIKTNKWIENGNSGKITLSVSDESGQSNAKTIAVEVFTPVLKVLSLAVNKVFDSERHIINRDTVSIDVVVENSGGAPAKNASIRFILEDIFVNYLDGSLQEISLDANSIDTFSFNLRVSDQCYDGYQFNGEIQLLGRNSSKTEFEFSKNLTSDVKLEGNGNAVSEYPFYNYYKANKTQMLYSCEDLGRFPIIIDSIGFNLAKVSNGKYYRSFKNFELLLFESSHQKLEYNYIDTVTVKPAQFYQEEMEMPAQAGWFFIDIDDFNYSGEQNLVVQMSWGSNEYASSYNDAFEVFAHKTEENSVVFGYSDFEDSPGVKGFSNYCPDVYFGSQHHKLNTVGLTVYDSNYPYYQDQVLVQIGERRINIPYRDTVSLQLSDAEFNYALLSVQDESTLYSGKFEVKAQDTVVVLGEHIEQVVSVEQIPSNIQCYNFQNDLIVHSLEEQLPIQCKVYDTTGRLVFSDRIETIGYRRKLPVITGVYLLLLNASNTNRTYLKKLVIQP